MLQPTANIVCLFVVLTLSAPQVTAYPNGSRTRERIPPTPHGERLVRAEFDQSPSAPLWSDAIESVQAAREHSLHANLADLERTEEVSGAYAQGRVQSLASVGLSYQTAGDYQQSMEYFRRALHLSRVNHGLYAANQLTILENMWVSEMSQGNLDVADEIRQYRYRVQQHAHASDNQAMLTATEEYTEWQRQLYLAGFGDDTFRRLLRMHSLRTDIIEQMESTGDLQPELILHLYERMASEYLLADYSGENQPLVQVNISSEPQVAPFMTTDLEQHEFEMIRNNCFRRGVKTLQKIIELITAQPPPQVEELARAKIALGDWYLWWDWKGRALQNYQEAYALYAHDNSPATDPQQLFYEPVELPEEPVFHPTLMTNTDIDPARARVSLTVSKMGRARDIEILELEPAGSIGARVTLLSMLREMRFRPLVVDGQAVATASIVREYRFNY